MKIKELISTPLISNILHTTDYHFMDEYTNNSIALDNHYIKLYGGLQVDEELIGATDTQTKTNITNEIRYYIIAHKEQLNRLYDINSLEYNPLYNVDGTTTTTFSEFETTNNYGIDKTTNNYDDIYTETHKGEQNNESKAGARNETSIDKVSGYNEGILVDDNSNTFTSNDVLNTSKDGARTDSTQTNERTDITTRDARNDKTIEKEHTITEQREGNIGTTKSTDLVQSEYDVWSKIAFWDVLFASIFATITLPMYE